ncbi:MAG: DHHA1 domain-containing protein, partial [Erysipelotrichales bacterium]
YDDIVRVVSMGDFSIELCGGTHVNKIEELGLFKIIKEESVGSGIRRIIATTSKTAYELLSSEVLKLDDIAVKIGVNDTTKINKKIDNILKVYGALKQEVEQYKEKFIESFNNSNEQEYIMINDHKVFITEVVTPDVKVMKSYIDSIKNEQENAIGITFSKEGKKPYVVGVSKDLINQDILAKNIANLINEKFDGKGGGKPDMAQGATNESINEDVLCSILEQK